jgi:hypothetical protein
MLKMRYAPCVFCFVLLADVAPSPFCGSRIRYEDTALVVSASDCSCASGTIEVFVDDQSAGVTTCGTNGRLTIKVANGPHTVRAAMANRTWPAKTYSVGVAQKTAVELGCPAE